MDKDKAGEESRAAGARAAAAGKAAVRKAMEDRVVAQLAREARDRERAAETERKGGSGKGCGRAGGDGLAELLGSKLRLKILLLMLKSGPVYSLEIVQLFEKNLFAVQSQLGRMEKMGIIRGFDAHRRTYYDLAGTHPLHAELTALLEKHLQGLPWREQSGYYMSPDLKKRENLLGGWY